MKHITYLVCLLLSSCAVPTKTEGWCFPKSVSVVMLTAFLLAFAVTSRAEEPLKIPGLDCRPELGACLIPIEILGQLVKAHNELVQENRDMRAELDKKAPKCATVEVEKKDKK